MSTVLLTVLASIAAIALGVALVVWLIVPLFKAIGWIFTQLGRFILGVLSDAARLVGSLVLMIAYAPLVVGNIIFGRWSAATHFGRAIGDEAANVGLYAYRILIGHPLRLVALGHVADGLEKRLPAVVAAAPGGDTPRPLPSGRSGQFDGYSIVGSLAGGGSGAKLYIAEGDALKQASFARMGHADVGQVVIKSFSLGEGSSLPQIVRESRSLDAAKRMGLILDHELTANRFYYVMRYVPGESLTLAAKKLHATSPNDGLGDAQMRTAISYARDLVATLATYHEGGLWHKDVKPDNVIVDNRTHRAHLVDFGLVSSLRSAMTLTTHGTEYFRDPEMVRLALKGVKVHEVDGARFDVYGAGAVLYALVEDSFPAHGALSQVSRRCPEAVKWVIRRAMADYDKRYAGAGEMLQDLNAIAAAPDMFAMRPFQLPSMGGLADAEPVPAGVAAAAVAAPAMPHAPRRATPPPVPSGRISPSIAVANWWSGESRVDGVARTPVPPTSFAKPSIPGRAGSRSDGPRRSAEEQLAAARARVEAAQARARSRPFSRMPSVGPRPYRAGITPGVVGGLVICALIAILISSVTSTSNRSGSPVSVVGEGMVPAMEIRTDGKVVSVIPGGDATQRVNPARPTLAELRNLPPLEGRVLVVCDLLQPWSPPVAAAVADMTGHLAARGITIIGNVPAGQDDKAAVELTAGLRTALAQTPTDQPEAITRMREWLEATRHKADAVDAVVWIAAAPPAPAVPGSVPAPATPTQVRTYTFVRDGATAALTDVVKAAARR